MANLPNEKRVRPQLNQGNAQCRHKYEPYDPTMKHFPRGEYLERCIHCGREKIVEVVGYGTNVSTDGESLCAMCGEHANEHGAIPHQFVSRTSKPSVSEIRTWFDEGLRRASDSTHWDNCWRDHWSCSMLLLFDEIGRLQKKVDDMLAADTSQQPYEKGWQDGRADAWAAYNAGSPPETKAPPAEIAWLIEQSFDGVAHWWYGSDFIADANQAVRFMRRQDAEQVILERGLNAKPSEHMWHEVPSETTQPQPGPVTYEPMDYIVQCRCGWKGNASQLKSLPGFKCGCPDCSAEFVPLDRMTFPVPAELQ